VTRLVRADWLRPGDTIETPRCQLLVVEELVTLDDGRIVVRWWRRGDERLRDRSRYWWKHPRDAAGKPRHIRYSLGALRAVNEAIDGRELGSLAPRGPGELVRLVARKEETVSEDWSVPEVVDVEADDEEPGTALTLFRTNDPKVALARMSEHAKVLVDVVRDRRLSQRIGNREHLLVEAWTTLGGMLGVHPIVAWTRPNETGDGYVARVEARTLDGRVVGAAEAECSRAETTWAKRPPYALRSMAQTRATSRALRAPLGQIVVLAGYEPAGVEEMPATPPPARAAARPVDRKSPTKAQAHEIATLIRRLEELAPERDWRVYCRTLVEGSPGGMSYEAAARVIRELDTHVEEIAGE
jgi:hypothetical protein